MRKEAWTRNWWISSLEDGLPGDYSDSSSMCFSPPPSCVRAYTSTPNTHRDISHFSFISHRPCFLLLFFSPSRCYIQQPPIFLSSRDYYLTTTRPSGPIYTVSSWLIYRLHAPPVLGASSCQRSASGAFSSCSVLSVSAPRPPIAVPVFPLNGSRVSYSHYSAGFPFLFHRARSWVL